MKTLLIVLAVLLLAVSVQAQSRLFISEYIEGSSNNKAVEIYNNTNTTITLSRVTIERYNNGSTDVSFSGTLDGSLGPGDVWIVANAAADAAILAIADDVINTSWTWYNGDDVLMLYLDGVLVDSIGRLGEDPGTFWGTDPVTTAEHTLVRKATDCVGDTNVDDAYDPAVYFDSYPQDEFGFLGQHATSCSPIAIDEGSWGHIKSLYR
jgi:predicted extracellular nuclease